MKSTPDDKNPGHASDFALIFFWIDYLFMIAAAIKLNTPIFAPRSKIFSWKNYMIIYWIKNKNLSEN